MPTPLVVFSYRVSLYDNILPQIKHPKLIVVVAFDRGGDGLV
jgi:hypothetical protein